MVCGFLVFGPENAAIAIPQTMRELTATPVPLGCVSLPMPAIRFMSLEAHDLGPRRRSCELPANLADRRLLWTLRNMHEPEEVRAAL